MSISRTAPLTRLLLTCAGLTLLPAMALPRVASAAPIPRPAYAASIAAVVVTLQDVTGIYGRGFTRTRAGVVGNQDAVQGASVIGADGSQLLRDGRVTGYSAQYSKGRLSFVVNNIDKFKSSSGAGRYFQYFKSFYAHHFLTGASTRTAAVGSQGLLRTSGSNGHFSASITFVRGRYVAGVTIVNSGKKPRAADLIKLAKIDDGSIQSHG